MPMQLMISARYLLKYLRFILLVPVPFVILSLTVLAQNPFLPSGLYFADPSAHVWKDGKLYLYGSLDESPDYYCSRRHHVVVTEDLQNWELYEDCFSSEGSVDEVPYNDDYLYAPDVGFWDGKYHLFYCQPDPNSAEGIAVSDKPTGPFVGGKPLDTLGHNQIDPSIFQDDDGKFYYLWGQFSMKMAEFDAEQLKLVPETLVEDVLTENEHHFHEGAFLFKREGLYYLVYADISREDKPTCIGYATSNQPMGPYRYRGVIVDNDGCNPNNWNNHGSVVQFKDHWYVLYHRSTQGSRMMRKACIEEIHFLDDGTIPEVEMTSQGVGGPLDARKLIEAEWACQLFGGLKVDSFGKSLEGLTGANREDHAIYKYIDFGTGVSKMWMRVLPGLRATSVVVSIDRPWFTYLKTEELPFAESSEADWQWVEISIPEISGVHALYLQFFGSDQMDTVIDAFRFE